MVTGGYCNILSMSIEIETVKVRNGLMSIQFPIEICVEKQLSSFKRQMFSFVLFNVYYKLIK